MDLDADVVRVSGREGAWRVIDEAGSRLVLERLPQRTVEQMHKEHGLRPMTAEEFDAHFGHLPSRPND